jgi:hypothetical protein
MEGGLIEQFPVASRIMDCGSLRESIEALVRATSDEDMGAVIMGSGKSGELWEELNPRQRSYLVVCYQHDQEIPAATRGRPLRKSATVQRRELPFSVRADPAFAGYTPIQEQLRSLGIHDSGTGATLRALSDRGLLLLTEDQVEVFPLGLVPRLLVTLTRRGRACARAGLGEPPAAPSSSGELLSPWLWRSLLKVAAAGTEGLPETDLWGRSRFYLGVGFRPQGVDSRGLVDLVPVEENVDGTSYVKEFRWRLTEEGRRHMNDHLNDYRLRYPEIAVNQIADIDR